MIGFYVKVTAMYAQSILSNGLKVRLNKMPKVIKNKKLTDEKVIKGLNELSQYTGLKIQIAQTLKEAIDLIKRQKSEIERLKSANDEKFRQWDMLAEKTKQHYADLYNEAKDILKAEAYKEFAEELKTY
jgi:hypothetical protein